MVDASRSLANLIGPCHVLSPLGRVAARARPGLVPARPPTRVWALASSPASHRSSPAAWPPARPTPPPSSAAAEIIWPTTVAAKWPHQLFTLARLHSRPRGGGLVSRHQDRGAPNSAAQPLLLPHRAVPVRDHSFYGPPMRSLSLWMQSPVSCSTGESSLSRPFASPKLPTTGQGLFRLVRPRRP